MIDSILKFVADKFKEWADKSKPIDVSNKITRIGSITVNTLSCNVKEGILSINGQFAMSGAMATGLTLEMFQVDSSLAAENDVYMIPLATYSNKGEVSMAYQRGKIYLHNEGPQIAIGTAIAFSGSWVIGGGATLKLATLLFSKGGGDMSVKVKADDLLRYAAKTLKGNLQIEQIWKNPNSSAQFADQDIALDTSEYEFIAVFSVPQNTITLIKRETGLGTYTIGAGYPTGGIWTYFRSVIIQDAEITFRDAYSVDYQNKTAMDNKAMIPDTIYGIKVIGGGQ